ncbi:MAG: hypothetical protein ABIT08_06645 [Bacteroidia bacterium]
MKKDADSNFLFTQSALHSPNQNFSVTIPGNPQELTGLGKRVNAKHVLDGATSVLTPLDMTHFTAKVTVATTKDAEAAQLDRDKEKAYEQRDLALGLNNDNPKTIKFYVTSARDTLLGFSKGKEHNLGDYGFNVNSSSGFVSVEIPTDAPGMMRLAGLIIAKDIALGAASLVKGLDMTDFAAKNTDADTKHTLGQKLNRDKEKATAARDKPLGIAEGQTVKTPGTVKFYVTSSRDVLLGLNKGEEHNLGDWGYDVQFSSGPGAPTGIFKATPSVIAAGASSLLDWNISGADTVTIDNGIGTVAASGSQSVTPAATTSYKLTATAAGGATLSITVTVTVV